MSQKWKLMYCNSGTRHKTHSLQNAKRPFATRLVAGKRSRIELAGTHTHTRNLVSCLVSGDCAGCPVKLILAELDS